MITETLMGPGRWSVRLVPDAMPGSLWDELDPDTGGFGHVLITEGHVEPDALGDGGMKASAVYTGVYTGASSRNELSGFGLPWWLGDADGLGDIFETAQTGVDPTASAADGSFVAWIRDLLPDAVTEGTLTAIAGTYTASLRLVTPRAAIDEVCDFFGGEWRVNPDGTLDAGSESDLFVTTPEAVLLWDGGGRENGLTGLHGVGLDVSRDLEDFTTRTVLVSDSQALGGADLSPATSYKDLHGNVAVRKRLISGSNVPAGSADTVASQQLGRFDAARKSYRLSTDEWRLRGTVAPGDYLWVFDPRPDANLVDTANQVEFRGVTLFPVKLRLLSVDWPVRKGMGVYFRAPDGDYFDLTEHVEFEGGAATLGVGAAPRRLTSGETVTSRQQRVQQSAAGLLARSTVTSSTASITSETDIASVTVSVGEARAVRVDVGVSVAPQTSGDRFAVRVYEDGTLVGRVGDLTAQAAGELRRVEGSVFAFPAAGSRTYKFTVGRVSGTGTGTVSASGSIPTYIAVSDAGPDRT